MRVKLLQVEFHKIKKYQDHFRKLVQLEREEEKQRHFDEIRKLSGPKRQKLGRAILDVNGRDSGRGLAGIYIIKYVGKKGLPKTNIAVGDLVIVSSGNPSGKEPQGTVMEKTNFSITVGFSKRPPSYAYMKNLRLDLYANDITFQRMLDALKSVRKNNELTDILLGKMKFKFEPKEINRFQNEQLNESQKLAVQKSLEAKNLFLIHGPPGTGKTTTLVESIVQHVLEENKVLATADSNTAVDNLVEKLAQQEVRVIRTGNPTRINPVLIEHSLDHLLEQEVDFRESANCWEQIDKKKELQKEYTLPSGQNRRGMRNEQIHKLAKSGRSFRGIPTETITAMSKWLQVQKEIDALAREAIQLEDKAVKKLLKNADVVCSTNSSSGSEMFEHWKFDVIFIDEATQAVEPACLIPMLKGRKFIMAGDHQQLPPTVLNLEAQEEFQYSMFERMIDIYGSDIVSMLNVQYRMNEAIMKFPNEAFYNNALQAHQLVAHHTLEDLVKDLIVVANPDWLNTAGDPKEACLFIDTGSHAQEERQEGSKSYLNKQEAEYVEELTKLLLGQGVNPRQIGIISPYEKQVDFLSQKLADVKELEIKTVDGFQGREKEVIIISFVRSNPREQIGFLKDYRRLNVAITRARRKLVMFGDANNLSTNEVFNQMLQKVKKVTI